MMPRPLSRAACPPLAAALLMIALPGLPRAHAAQPTFDDDVAFLRQHAVVVVLGEAPGARVAVVPAWQGRVITSTVGGLAPASYGWINRELIGSRQLQPHINAFGGEDRFWLGPEGGQFSIFFAKGDPFDLEHWQTPPLIDTEAYAVTARGPEHVSFRREGRLVNYSGTTFDIRIDRTVRLLEPSAAARELGVALTPAVQLVAFASENVITNAGTKPWIRDQGLLSIWILGMFKPGARTTVVIPYRAGSEAERGPLVNDAYFGKVPPDRLVARDGVLYFKGDGQHRSKIGLSPQRATNVLGSFDPDEQVLTIVTYTRPAGATDYVNSMWEIQKEPFRGDVINSYNDGPPAPGVKPLGPFYELETSSPAAALAPGESLSHTHTTFHIRGEWKVLDGLARKILGVGLDTVESALAPER
jgi:hypothetical protein